MTETPNRRAAAAAGPRIPAGKIDRRADIADTARAIDAAVQARRAADRHITGCQQAYGQKRRAALAAGWMDTELEYLGWTPEYDPRPPPRRRPAAPGQDTHPATAAEPDISPRTSARSPWRPLRRAR